MSFVTTRPPQMGFAVKVAAREDLKSHDTRRHKNDPHLRTSLEYLDAILDYLDQADIRVYRMSSDLAPYATHPDMPRFHNMVRESDAELRAVGAKARRLGIRLSFHPSQYILLNTPDPEVLRKSINDFASQADMLDRMGLDLNSVMVTHVGGVYGDHASARARWVENYLALPDAIRRRIVLENDDLRFSLADVLWVHARTDVRLIFDHQHHWCYNPENTDMVDGFARALDSWPADQRPKIHFSSPRTAMRTVQRRDPKTKKLKTVQQPPIWTGHADFVHPFEFIRFMRQCLHLRDFDVMLEAKQKDLAVLRLRADLLKYAPDVAQHFGLGIEDVVVPDPDQLLVAAE